MTQFRITFTEDTTLCGYFKAHLFMSTDEGNDMDMFLYVNKEDSLGVCRLPGSVGRQFYGCGSSLTVVTQKN